jgi:hypothetical protein
MQSPRTFADSRRELPWNARHSRSDLRCGGTGPHTRTLRLAPRVGYSAARLWTGLLKAQATRSARITTFMPTIGGTT